MGVYKYNILYAKEKAEANGGLCLSDIYINNETKLLFRCKNKHIFKMTLEHVNNGHWCPVCRHKEGGIKIQKHTIDELKMLAKSRGGKLLSKKYKGVENKLKWSCSEQHIWMATPHHILANHWCPECSSYFNERICRKIFETIFDNKFPKRRPKWLMMGKKRLELDGYAENLKIAFEYQGIQHFKEVGFTRNSELNKRVNYDFYKIRKCKENGITLFVIPYTKEYNEITEYVISECNRIGIKYVRDTVNLSPYDKFRRGTLDELIKIAKSRGGECLSKTYVSGKYKLEWECSKKHRWYAAPDAIKQGTWCPKCSYDSRFKKTLGKIHPRLSLIDAERLAISRNGKCLSKEYLNNKSPLIWECDRGHIWKSSYSSVKNQNTWCHKCLMLKISQGWGYGIKSMKKIANERGGKCLSKIYINNTTKLKWQCKNDHIWKATPVSIVKKKSWCHECYINYLKGRKTSKIIQYKSY